MSYQFDSYSFTVKCDLPEDVALHPPHSFPVALVALGNAEFPASQISSWLKPLIENMPAWSWVSVEIDLRYRDFVEIVYARAGLEGHHCLQTTTSQATHRQLERLCEGYETALVVFIDRASSQVHALLDQVADALFPKDFNSSELAPLRRLLSLLELAL